MRVAAPLVALLLIALQAVAMAQTATEPSPAPASEPEHYDNSMFLIESEIDRLNDRKEVLERRRSLLKQFAVQVDTELKNLSKVEEELEALTTTFNDLNMQFSRIDRESSSGPAPEAPVVPPKPRGAEAQIRANTTYFCALFQDPADPLADIESKSEELESKIFRQEQRLDEIRGRIEQISISVSQVLANEQGLQAPMVGIAREAYGEYGRFRNAVDRYDSIANTLGYIKNTLRRLDRNRADLERDGSDLKARLAYLLTTTEEELTTNDRERGRYQRDLAAAYQKASEQAGIDNLLSWAIIGMIIAMVALYFSLLTFRQGLADAIIEERTLLELLSMGFLMLTVIILGTGKLLTIESLAALLGTIAGYIFGRRTSGAEDQDSE